MLNPLLPLRGGGVVTRWKVEKEKYRVSIHDASILFEKKCVCFCHVRVCGQGECLSLLKESKAASVLKVQMYLAVVVDMARI